jgi:hypothetical protein
MPNPDKFHKSAILFGLFAFSLLFMLFGLGGCVDPMDAPRKVCTKSGEPYTTSRGYVVRDCVRYEIQCLPPLILDSKDGKLFCRLREPNEQG